VVKPDPHLSAAGGDSSTDDYLDEMEAAARRRCEPAKAETREPAALSVQPCPPVLFCSAHSAVLAASSAIDHSASLVEKLLHGSYECIADRLVVSPFVITEPDYSPVISLLFPRILPRLSSLSVTAPPLWVSAWSRLTIASLRRSVRALNILSRFLTRALLCSALLCSLPQLDTHSARRLSEFATHRLVAVSVSGAMLSLHCHR
jgi:hypothetical protein